MTARVRRRRRSGWLGVVLLLVLAAGYYFFGGFALRKEAYPPNAFYEVKRADMLISIVEDGALRALNETVVRSALEGLNRIIYLAPEGSYVQKGDLLVELDSSGLKDRFNEQELAYQERLFQVMQAAGNLKIQKSLAESQIKEAELKVENAQADLEKYRDGDAPLLIQTVEARTGVLAEQVRIATERYARTQELFKSGNASKSELEADALILKREELALSQYREDLRLIKKFDQPNQLRLLQSNLEQAQAELSRLKQRTSNEIAQAEGDLTTSQAGLDVMEAGLKTQQRRLENAKILAPQNGLVVHASVSPFQFLGEDERRREEGRFRGRDRGGGDGGGREFRGGGGRGGRSNFESSLSSSSGASGGSGGTSGSSSTAQTIASGNQRIASAVSGTPETASGGGGTGGSDGSSASGGGRAGGSSGGSTGGGQNTTSPAGAFASYPSMRPSSLFGASSASNSAAGAGNGSASSSSTSTSQGSSARDGNLFAGGVQFGNNQFGFRSSQGFRDFGFDFYGTAGLLEEGTMVRQRQELIRLPDVSKMLAEIKISESRVRQVHPGMTAYVSVHNIPHRRFKAAVRRVAFMPDSQSSWMNPNVKLYPADILVDEEMPILKPGVSASAEIIITNLTNVLSVPIQTVARLRGENVCFVKRGSSVRPVPVTTGWFNDAFVEITSGLKDGDFVLLAPVGDEDIEETPSAETNNVDAATEAMPQPPDSPRREMYDSTRSPDSLRRDDPSDPSSRGGPSDSRSRSDSFDPSRRRESFDPAQPGQEPPSEERRFRRRDSEGTNGAPPFERRRGRPGGRRPQTEDAPE